MYLLDAATPNERKEFEHAAEALPEVRAEAVHLASVVAVLNRLYDLEAVEAPGAFDLDVKPSPELRARILADVAAEAKAPTPVAAPTSIGPQGRVRANDPVAIVPEPLRSPHGWRTPWMAAAAMLVIAVGVTLWALALQSQKDNQAREIRAQSTEIAQIRANANASAYSLSATADGPEQAAGTLFYSLKDQRAFLYMEHLPQPDANHVYQLWYIAGDNAPAPGETFSVNASGPTLLATSPDITSFNAVALTQEPKGGSKTPTTPVLMVGTTGGIAG